MISPMPQPTPLVTLRLEGKVVEAICSLCRDPLALGNQIGSAEEQELKLKEAFARHVFQRHRSKETGEPFSPPSDVAVAPAGL